MGQIVKRKKKGRPSKADLARRAATPGLPASSSPPPERDVRRSLRRRNVRYMFDFDDYIDDEDEEDEDEDDDENERRREKELKQLLLKSKGSESEPSRTRRVEHAPSSSDDDEEEDGRNRSKKRKINGDFELDREDDEEDDRGNEDTNQVENDEIDDEDDEEVKERKAGSNGACSVPGTMPCPRLGIPLPDKKTLEMILDRLQKKDRYSVYAEPVDPEELPDYFDVIEQPMDFATVRKKLANGSYLTLEQFENDVFLICSNAMQYNAPDTVYYRQARSIRELAKKKFEMLRGDLEHWEKEVKSEDKIAPNSLDKKQTEKQLSRNAQGVLGSDSYSCLNSANAGDFQTSPNLPQAGGFARPSNAGPSPPQAGGFARPSNAGPHPPQAIGFARPSNADGSSERNNSPVDNNLDKGEDLYSGRSFLSKVGRKPMINDEDRRATYKISTEPVTKSESMLSTFDSEIKQLVAVGINSDHSYARSLARFAAVLGPVAWKAAARRIEQALPPGYKFGRGWVGDYEPLPTPTLQLENCYPKEPLFLTQASDGKRDAKLLKCSASAPPVHISSSEGKPSLFGGAVTKTPGSSNVSAPVPASDQSFKEGNLEGKQPFFSSGGTRPASATVNYQQQQSPQSRPASASVNYQPQQQQSPQTRNFEPQKKAVKQVELNCSPASANRDPIIGRQVSNGTEMPASKSAGTISRYPNPMQPVPFKPVENDSRVTGPPSRNVSNHGLDRNRIVKSTSSDSLPNQMAAATGYYPHGQDQGLTDPVQLMRMMAENAQRQQQSMNRGAVGSSPLLPRNDPGNASAVAAQTWMSIGAGGSKGAADNTSCSQKNQMFAESFNNPHQGDVHMQMARQRGDFPVPGMQFQASKNGFPLQTFMPVQLGGSNGAQFLNGPMVSPQLATADLSRFQVQSPWQAVNPQNQQARQRQQSLPPDLNIGFHSSGSPVSQSSGVLVDSQQPDLALQL